MNNFVELTSEEQLNIDGGSVILTILGIVGIAAGCVALFGAGYHLARWLG